METPEFKTVGIVGAGAMGRGIAQIAAQAGSKVLLFDTQADAVAKARESVAAQWDKLVEKGRIDAAAALQMLTKSAAFSDAPPTSPPSTSGWAKISPAMSGLSDVAWTTSSSAVRYQCDTTRERTR